jgi:hypothetical protein
MPGKYDPNCEATNEKKVVAARWECLRRNEDFRTLSERWLESEEFRRSHAVSPIYNDPKHHTPRCAWDWMLTATQRVELAEFQIEKRQWFVDSDFNFGPIICRRNFSLAAVTEKSWREFLRVEPLLNPPPPLAVSQAWDRTPNLFKEQFRLASIGNIAFGEINAGLHQHANLMAIAASKLAAGDPLKEMPIIAHYLGEFGRELHKLAEFTKVFKIPKSRYSEKRFRLFLGQIRESFKAAKLLLPTKTYDTHKSYQGTEEDWRWFLEAERLGLDIHKSADARKLAELYSEDLRQRTMRGRAPRRAKAHGFSGSKFSSRVIKNRRSTVKRHVLTIEKWIRASYPPQTPEPGATAS